MLQYHTNGIAGVDSESPRRVLGLDAVRAFAVVAMIFGHTLDAVLLTADRGDPFIVNYWKLRGVTAPLFLFVSGWVLFHVVDRRRLHQWSVVAAYLPRVALLLLLGFLMRLPLWGMDDLLSGDRAVLEHFFALDALHCIALAMLIMLAVCALIAPRRRRAVVLAVTAIVVIPAAPLVQQAMSTHSGQRAFVVAQVFAGGTSLFPLFPWAAYYFAGAAVGAGIMCLGGAARRVAAAAAAASCFFVFSWLLSRCLAPSLIEAEFELVSFRLGWVLAFVSVAFALPLAFSVRLVPIGRASLWAYVFHVPVVYGWGVWPGLGTRLGPVLATPLAVSLACFMIVITSLVAVVGQRTVDAWRPAAAMRVAAERVRELCLSLGSVAARLRAFGVRPAILLRRPKKHGECARVDGNAYLCS